MAIDEEARAQLGELAMRAIDTIVERYGEAAVLVDAVLVYEVDTSGEDDSRYMCEVDGVSFSGRPTADGGIAQVFANLRLHGWEQ